MKRCPGCCRILPPILANFYRNRSKPDGLSTYCKPCQNGYTESCPSHAPERVTARKKAAYWRAKEYPRD